MESTLMSNYTIGDVTVGEHSIRVYRAGEGILNPYYSCTDQGPA
jgi:hypothetical protein